MIWDKLEIYLARKELSVKAIKEVGEILKNYQFDSIEEIESLVKVLLKLDSDVTYNFFTDNTSVFSDEFIKNIVSVYDVKNPSKSGRVYVAVIALAKAQYTEYANALLLKFVSANISGKLNKQLYEGFRRTVKYGRDSYLFSKIDGWTERDLNLYARLLSESETFLNDSEFTECVKKFCSVNGKSNILSCKVEKDDKPSLSDASEPQKIKSVGSKIPVLELNEILNLLEGKIASIKSEMFSKEEAIKNLKDENLKLKAIETVLRKDKENLVAHNQELTQKILDMEKKIKAQDKEIEVVREKTENYKSMLSNVESAFGQAGQTEIDALKGNIRKRLSLEYEKYIEIKDKTPDLGYYEILLAVLEDVFRVLKKNGISF